MTKPCLKCSQPITKGSAKQAKCPNCGWVWRGR